MNAIKDIIDIDSLNLNSEHLSEKYKTAHPFPYIVFDDFLIKEKSLQAVKEFPSPKSKQWTYFLHFNKKSNELSDQNLIPKNLSEIITTLNSDVFMQFLRKLTGIDNLIPDKSTAAGGLLMTKRGGFLNIHADFATHPKNKYWKRRVNVLVYMNEDWKEEYGGHLEFWSKDMKQCKQKILPSLNRCVIFNTDLDCYHGHPEPLKCPEDKARQVIALYYFTDEKESSNYYTTIYKARPADKFKRVLIYMDYSLLKAYNWVKVALGISDNLASRILKIFSRK